MIVFPAVATLVSAAFAAQLLRQYARRKRLPQLAWGISLAMYAAASLAVAAGISGGWDPTLYRIYYLFGALLNVPFLALGSLALLGKRVLSAFALLVVVGAGAYAVAKVAGTATLASALATEQIPRGKDVWSDQTVPRLASAYSITGWAVVVAVTALTSVRRAQRRPPPERVRANWLIAAGVTIVAAGSTALTRVGRGAPFSVTLALGVIVMFLGFRLASRPPPTRPGSLVLYTSADCHLCDEAREALARLDLPYEEVFVPDGHPYRLRTPVLEAGGRPVAEGRFDEAALRRALGR